MDQKLPIRVAVVGSGMAGLATAFLLHRDPHKRYKVTIFESGKSLSLDSASVSLPSTIPGLRNDRIDIPMRAFAGGYYNNLKAMYDYLGIQYHPQPFVFKFTETLPKNGDRTETDRTQFIHASNYHRIPPPRPRAKSILEYIEDIVYLLVCYTWFTICCFFVPPRTSSEDLGETVRDYVNRIRLPRYFLRYFLLPLICSVATCSHEQFLDFSATDLINYKRRTHMMQHYVVSNGVSTVQDKLIQGIPFELSATVTSVEPETNGIKILWRKMDSQQTNKLQEAIFDRVILGVSPDVVGQIFAPLKSAMAKIPTTKVESVVHKSREPMGPSTRIPSRDANRPASQLICLRTSIVDDLGCTEAIHVQPSGAIVATCPLHPVDSELVIKSSKFTRVMRTPESRRLLNKLFENRGGGKWVADEKHKIQWRNGDGNVWLVGGWCWDGMVLLEGCVVSAMRAAGDLGVEVPWSGTRCR